MVFILAQEYYHKKIVSLDIIERQHAKKEYLNEKTKESWVILYEDQTSESEIGKVPSC